MQRCLARPPARLPAAVWTWSSGSGPAIAGRATVLLTKNQSDFPAEHLSKNGVTLTDADTYLRDLLRHRPVDVTGTVRRLSAEKKHPPAHHATSSKDSDARVGPASPTDSAHGSAVPARYRRANQSRANQPPRTEPQVPDSGSPSGCIPAFQNGGFGVRRGVDVFGTSLAMPMHGRPVRGPRSRSLVEAIDECNEM